MPKRWPNFGSKKSPPSAIAQPHDGSRNPISGSAVSVKAPPEINFTEGDIIIAVLGATGTGKSTFINLVSGSKLHVNVDGLTVCTRDVEATAPFNFQDPVTLQDRKVVLIDTPCCEENTEVLELVAKFIKTTYKDGTKLAGMIYMHPITKSRLSGTARPDFSKFRTLCGDDSLKNVAIVSNFWSEVDPTKGAARETELRTKDTYFKPDLDLHAKLLRHYGTTDTAANIIQAIMSNHPIALRIQQEILDEKKSLLETAVGIELNRELVTEALKLAKELKEIREEMKVAIDICDEEWRQEMEVAETKLKAEIQHVLTDLQKLGATHHDDKARMAQIMKLQEQLRAEEQQRFDAQQAATQKEMADLQRMHEQKKKWETHKGHISIAVMGSYRHREVNSTLRAFTMVAEVAILITFLVQFINLISGSKLGVSEDLESCTDAMSATAPFDFQGRKVVLFDTPGFDDTTKSDTDILKMITTFLITYQDGVKLAGVIYMHRINDVRVGGIGRRNFTMFRKLCGDQSLKNVVIVTNFWSEVDPTKGAARETELCTKYKFFKPVLDLHAKLLRHDGTRAGASTIIEGIMGNHPIALRIQEEMIFEKKSLLETAAGTELNHDLKGLALKHAKELKEIREEMKVAIEERDEKARQNLEAAETNLNAEVQRVRRDLQKLAATHSAEMKQLEEKLQADNLSNTERDELLKQIAALLARTLLQRLRNSTPKVLLNTP